jgi:RNA polymerase sigma-70 factor (ECF subfamily)
LLPASPHRPESTDSLTDIRTDLPAQPSGAPSELSRLASSLSAGGREEVEALLERVQVIAHRYCRAVFASYPNRAHAADDVAQEICLAVFAALPDYRDRGAPFESFVFAIARRKVADAQRIWYRHPVWSLDLSDLADDTPTPEEHAVTASQLQLATTLLHRLPERLRQLILLRVAAGFSAEETGAALGMTAGAVRVAQHRGVATLRRLAAVSHDHEGRACDSES